MMVDFDKIFERFLEHKDTLKTIFVASCDKEGRPNSAPKMLIEIEKPNKVLFLDYKFTRTYANIPRNPHLSVSFMDDMTFTGYRLNGSGEAIESGLEFDLAKVKWEERVTKYFVDRLIKRIHGEPSAKIAENKLPENFIVVKFTAAEASVVEPDRVLRAISGQ